MQTEILQSHARAADDGLMVSSTARRAKPVPLAASSPVYVRLRRAHGQWYAQAVDVQIVGVGGTRSDALASLSKLLKTGVRHARVGGAARHETPRSDRLKVRLLALLSRPMPASRRWAQRVQL